MQQLLLLFAARFVTAGIVGVLASLVMSLYYTDIEGVTDPAEVMLDRPAAAGSPQAVLDAHSDHCWTGAPKGVTTGALLREHPNDPVRYITWRSPLFIPAVEQAVQGKDRGLDTVVALCTDRRPTTRKG